MFIDLLPYKQPGAFLATPMGEIRLCPCHFLGGHCRHGPFSDPEGMGLSIPWNMGLPGHRIETLCRRAGMKYRDILKWDLFAGSMITAGVMGIWGQVSLYSGYPVSSYPCLATDELDAVIVHEIGHVQHRHIHFYLLFFAGYIACIYSFLDPLVMLIVSRPLLDFSGRDFRCPGRA